MSDMSSSDLLAFMNRPGISIIPDECSTDDLIKLRKMVNSVIKYLMDNKRINIHCHIEITDTKPDDICAHSSDLSHDLVEMTEVPDGKGALVCIHCGSRFRKYDRKTTFEEAKQLALFGD